MKDKIKKNNFRETQKGSRDPLSGNGGRTKGKEEGKRDVIYVNSRHVWQVLCVAFLIFPLPVLVG